MDVGGRPGGRRCRDRTSRGCGHGSGASDVLPLFEARAGSRLERSRGRGEGGRLRRRGPDGAAKRSRGARAGGRGSAAGDRRHHVAPRLKMVALKDFFWRKTEKGWIIEDCPLGDGQVDWSWFGSVLRDVRFAGPISMHLEYETGGSTPQERTRRALDAARRDLTFARRVLAL